MEGRGFRIPLFRFAQWTSFFLLILWVLICTYFIKTSLFSIMMIILFYSILTSVSNSRFLNDEEIITLTWYVNYIKNCNDLREKKKQENVGKTCYTTKPFLHGKIWDTKRFKKIKTIQELHPFGKFVTEVLILWQQILFFSWISYLLLTVAPIFVPDFFENMS